MKCLLVFYVTIVCCQRVAAVNYSQFCPLQSSEIVAVKRDRYTGSYVIQEDYESNLVPPKNRQLRSGGSEDAISISTVVSQEHDRELSLVGDVHYVRRCTCAYRPGNSEYQPYCPLEKDNCGVPISEDEPVQCFNLSTRSSLIQNGWKAAIMAYGLIFIYLVLGDKGRNARLYVTSMCCGRHELNATEQDSDTTTTTEQRPSELILKTKLYVPPRHVQEDDDVACTICFAPLEEGERVGALTCSHQFHTDCLKEWLPRRNTCPLCQAPDVATPRYKDESKKDEENERDDAVVYQDESEQQESERDDAVVHQDESEQQESERDDAAVHQIESEQQESERDDAAVHQMEPEQQQISSEKEEKERRSNS